LERLLTAPNLDTPAGLRDRAILEVLFSTGLRVSELAGLNREQVNLDKGEFGVIGKGRRPRVVFLSDRAVMWLRRWLESRDDNYSAVFIRFSGPRRKTAHVSTIKNSPTQDGEEFRLTTRSIGRVVDKYSKKACLPVKLSPHSLRHSFATDLLSNGANLRDVQEMLGHKSIVTTQIYTHVTQPKLRAAHKKFHHKDNDENRDCSVSELAA